MYHPEGIVGSVYRKIMNDHLTNDISMSIPDEARVLPVV
jgi:hypothetical protein